MGVDVEGDPIGDAVDVGALELAGYGNDQAGGVDRFGELLEFGNECFGGSVFESIYSSLKRPQKAMEGWL